ncbi:hypothetical protein R6Q59_010034 [Mikania micrantha]
MLAEASRNTVEDHRRIAAGSRSELLQTVPESWNDTFQCLNDNIEQQRLHTQPLAMFPYRILEHKVPCQHIREYPSALAYEEEDVLHLAVKQYIPLDNPNPQPGDVTIIAAHANGFPKELYEPLWEDLLSRTQINGFKIRNIWMADVAQQGASGVLNENLLGNDPGWFDHSRDLLNLINLKRNEMPRPLIGIGHSMGGAQIVNLSYFHPRLFTTVILIDPVIQIKSAELRKDARTPSVARMSTFRRDTWPSRSEAATSFRKSAFYQTWDQRCFDRWIEHGLRSLPTPSHPQQNTQQVTLTTPISHEVFTFLRRNYEGYTSPASPDSPNPANRKTHPDIHPAIETVSPFYRSEAPATFMNLSALRPSAFYIFAELSTTSTPAFNEAKLKNTGVGWNGSGGVEEGKVDSVTMKGVGHLAPMEDVAGCADVVAAWIGREYRGWRSDWEERDRVWVKGKELREKQEVEQEWKDKMGGSPKRKMKDSKL